MADRDPYAGAPRAYLREELTRLIDQLGPVSTEMRIAEIRAGTLDTQDLRALVRMMAAKVRQREGADEARRGERG